MERTTQKRTWMTIDSERIYFQDKRTVCEVKFSREIVNSRT